MIAIAKSLELALAFKRVPPVIKLNSLSSFNLRNKSSS